MLEFYRHKDGQLEQLVLDMILHRGGYLFFDHRVSCVGLKKRRKPAAPAAPPKPPEPQQRALDFDARPVKLQVGELCEETVEAIERVDRAADKQWQEDMYESLVSVAGRMPEFTNDETVDEFDRLGFKSKTHDTRALGPVVLRARRAGMIEPTIRQATSKRRTHHNGLLRVWKSLIHEGGSYGK
jgi:hypothetical protein